MYFAGKGAKRRWERLTVLAIMLAIVAFAAPAQDTKAKRQRWADDADPKPSFAAAHLTQASSGALGTTTSVRYSGQGDFSVTQNPNGVWSYGYEAVLGGAFTRYTVSSSSGFIGWFGPVLGDPGGPPGFPLIIGPTATTPPLLNIHPSPELYSVLRWTAPATGRWDVVGDFTGTGLTTTDVHILRNGISLF